MLVGMGAVPERQAGEQLSKADSLVGLRTQTVSANKRAVSRRQAVMENQVGKLTGQSQQVCQ